jgi:hypothetical protein
MRRGARPGGAWFLVLGILGACGGSDSSTDAASALQLRPVQDVVQRVSPAWEATELTCPGKDAAGCLAAAGAEPVVVPGADRAKYLLGPLIVDGGDVDGAKAYEGPGGTGWAVDVQLTSEGSDALASATRASVDGRIAMVVDGLVVSAPTVQQPVTVGMVIVAGRLSEAEAKRLAQRLDPRS